MHTIEQEILEAIQKLELNNIGIIIIAGLTLVNTCGIYSLLKKIIKIEKEKRQDRDDIIQALNRIDNNTKK